MSLIMFCGVVVTLMTVVQGHVLHVQGRSAVPRSGSAGSNGGASNLSKCARKDCGPNWSVGEIIALINAKRDLFLEEMDVVDCRDSMHRDASKWIRISIEVMQAGLSPCPRDGPACKSK